MIPPLISIADAREQVLAETVQLQSEPVPLAIARGRVLAQDVRAGSDLPAFVNSAMDGFALRGGTSSRRLDVVGESRAGTPAARAVGPGEAIRISTGGALPAGADAVVRLEDVVERDGTIELAVEVAVGANVRQVGEDLRAGTVVVPAGRRVGAGELAVAGGAGLERVAVARMPRVAILSTGDELRPLGAPLAPGQIHNSNALALAALTQDAGAEVVLSEIVRDELTATREAFAAALDAADVVIASGGVSVGPHDHVKPALLALGVRERFWRVSLQPGKPTWFGTRGERLVFGLPGNPVSAYITFLLFARPALLALQGAPPLPPRAAATLSAAVRRGAREQALRVRLDERDGRVRAQPTGSQGSHITGSLLGADALAFLAPGEGSAAAGETVAVERI